MSILNTHRQTHLTCLLLGDIWSRHEERVRGWVGGMDWAVRGRNRLDADYSVTIRKHGVKSVIKRC